MPVFSDFALGRLENGSLTISMSPPTGISGWSLQYIQTRRLGGTAIVSKFAASGYNNVSGINVTDGARGVLSVALTPGEMSGFTDGTYSYQVLRINSGLQTVISTGYRLCGI